MNKIVNIIKQIALSLVGLLIYLGLSLLFGLFINYTSNSSIKVIILILSDIVVLLTLFLLNKKKLIDDFKSFDKNSKKHLLFGIKCYLYGLCLMMVSNIVLNMFLHTIAENEQIVENVLLLYPYYAVPATIIFGPLIEEIVFRLYLKKYIQNKKVYYVVATLLFAGAHVVGSFNTYSDLLFILPYATLSFAFAYIYDKTDNIYTTVVIHQVHNTISILLYILRLMVI